MSRFTATSRDVRAGCFICSGSDARWFGGQAQGTAARHHDATGHATWCDVVMSVRYGTEAPDPRQIDIEDSIAASSGDQPDAIPLPEFDAPAVAPAGVRVPEGRSVEKRARGRKPEPAHV
jgi:hypothetical protein